MPRLAHDLQLLGVSTPSATTDACQRAASSWSARRTASVRVVQDAALDERQVDLDDVELDLAQQPEAGVAGADVVGGEPHAGLAAGRHVASQAARGP